MLEMIETAAEKMNERQNWFQSLKTSSTSRQKKREIREKEKKTLEEENERFRSFINKSR